MKTAKMLNRIRLLTIPKIIIIGLLFMFIFANFVVAQSQSPKAGQWKSVGGKIAFSGKHNFKTMWHLGGNNMYWKNDEDRIKTSATHPFENEVKNDVIVKKGQITVRGPGHIGAFIRSIRGGTTSGLTFSKTGKEFGTASLGRQELLGSGDNWNWQDIFINDFNLNAPHKGWVPADSTVTLDVWATSEHTRGTWFQGYAAPRGVECEYWYFSQEGGKIIKVIKYGPKGEEIDVTPIQFDEPPTGKIMGGTYEPILPPNEPITGKQDVIIDEPEPVKYVIVKELKGDVIIDYGNFVKKQLKVGDHINFGEILVTGDNSYVHFKSWDGKADFYIEKYSKIKLFNKHVFPFQTRPKKGFLGIFYYVIIEGGAANIKKIGTDIMVEIGLWPVEEKGDSYIYETSRTSVGVHGSTVRVTHNKSSGDKSIAVVEGEASVLCSLQPETLWSVKPGEKLIMDKYCNVQKYNLTKSEIKKINSVFPDVKETAGQTPIADSHVYAYSYRNWNKTNWGKYNIIRAGWLPTGGEKRAYLKFDLSGVNPANVGKATLRLFHNYTGGNNSLSLGVHLVTGSWQEGSDTYHSGQTEKTAAYGEISWVNQPSFDFNSIAFFNPGTGTNKWVEVDVTPLVKAWLSGTPNYGLVIKPRGIMSGRAPVSTYGFYSREFEDADRHPVLVISGSGSVSPPEGGLGGDVIDYNSGGIKVESATYGSNCDGVINGNVTAHIADQANGKSKYKYTVDYRIIGDPAPWCAKTYTVQYRCGNNPHVYEISLPEEAGWGDKSVVLDCEGNRYYYDVIKVESATYGGNCDGVVNGNVTAHIADQANGKSKLQYTVNYRIIGDPAPGCAKTYTVRYRCGNNPQVHEISLPKEAGFGDKVIVLDCEGN